MKRSLCEYSRMVIISDKEPTISKSPLARASTLPATRFVRFQLQPSDAAQALLMLACWSQQAITHLNTENLIYKE